MLKRHRVVYYLREPLFYTMSLNIRMNKWAPKLTITFQLTIWSIVGIILLRKGAISLCEKMKARNDTFNIQEKLMGREGRKEDELVRESNTTKNRLKIIKLKIETQWKDVTTDNADVTALNEQWPHKLHTFHRTGNIDSGISETISTISTISTIKKRTAIHYEQDGRDIRSIQTPTVYASNKNEVEKINREENVIVPLASNENPYDAKNTMINDSTPSVSFESKDSGSTNFITMNEKNFFQPENNEISYKDTEKSKSETKSRHSTVNRVGAAIAIIMLAIGVVMLLLGPLIIIVRAFSNRRRTRKMLSKSMCYNDQPPTYEEVTLMDQAPRYSTLQLDITILDSSFSL